MYMPHAIQCYDYVTKTTEDISMKLYKWVEGNFNQTLFFFFLIPYKGQGHGVRICWKL
jgi:hypothetical protein